MNSLTSEPPSLRSRVHLHRWPLPPTGVFLRDHRVANASPQRVSVSALSPPVLDLTPSLEGAASAASLLVLRLVTAVIVQCALGELSAGGALPAGPRFWRSEPEAPGGTRTGSRRGGADLFMPGPPSLRRRDHLSQSPPPLGRDFLPDRRAVDAPPRRDLHSAYRAGSSLPAVT